MDVATAVDPLNKAATSSPTGYKPDDHDANDIRYMTDEHRYMVLQELLQ